MAKKRPNAGISDQKTPKVAIYVRVSTEEQAKEGLSIGAQKDRCQAFCRARGWDVYKIYVDAGYSAGTVKRPAFQELLKDVESRLFNILLVYKIDRFSRRLKDLIDIFEELKENNVNFTSVTEQIDTTTAMGEAFFQIIGVFAQLERGMVRERVEMAFERKINAGELLNRPPLGYRFENKKLVINEDEAQIVRQIFQMWADGIHYSEISKRFNIPISTLYIIIRNPTYIGKVPYRGHTFDATHKPIVSEELFNRVNNCLRIKGKI